jgi:hypothetical protein
MNHRFSKSLILIGLVSLLAAGTSFAAPGNGQGVGPANPGAADSAPGIDRGAGPAQRMARFSETLQLTESQEDEILEFFRAREAEREAMQQRIADTFGQQICEQRAANDGAFEELLLSVLNEDQLLIHEEMKAQREARKASRKMSRRGGGLDCSIYDVDG